MELPGTAIVAGAFRDPPSRLPCALAPLEPRDDPFSDTFPFEFGDHPSSTLSLRAFLILFSLAAARAVG